MKSRLLCLLALTLAPALVNSQVAVTTWHNDNWRTGQNTSETTLTPNLVSNVNSFGKLCSATVDGQVHAQPLVANVSIGGVSHTAVFVVTESATVYAFDGVNFTAGKPCIQLAKRHLPPTGSPSAHGGISGTPVIDTVTNTLYLVAGMLINSTTTHYVYALDITSTTLSNKVAPVQVASGAFLSANSTQRPALLGLSSGSGSPFSTIYAGFARIDNPSANHRGWVFSYNTPNLSLASAYCVTCGSSAANGGGIWMGAAGLAAGVDSSGTNYLYFATGDGTFDLNTGGQDSGDSFLKMPTNLSAVTDYFTPADQACRICTTGGAERDVDFGSGGVTLIPDGLLSNYPHLAVVADKTGSIWVIDRSNPGKFNGTVTGKCPNRLCTGANANVETVKASENEFHNSPAYFNGSLYYAAVNDTLKLYPLANSTCAAGTPPLCSAQAATTVVFPYGTTPSVSANGAASGIVWALNPTGASKSTTPGTLYAFGAGTLAELYNSSQCTIGGVAQDQPGAAISFTVPTIANGRVYVGTMGGTTGGQGSFHMYGTLSRTCDTASSKQPPAPTGVAVK